MYDKRVFRGSTNAAMVIPSGGYPDALFDNRKEKAKAKAQAREIVEPQVHHFGLLFDD